MNEPNQQAAQRILDTKRDMDGRLVGLTLDFGLGDAPAGNNAWLIACDGSECSQRAVGEAIRLASKMGDCVLHVVNVQHWMSKEAAESGFLYEGQRATDVAKAMLEQAGLPWNLHILMGDPAGCIVALADTLGCHGVVIGSRGIGPAGNLLMGSVAYKVIHLSRIAVLVVR